MAELLLELFSEEIPARMQQGAARDLQSLLAESLSALSPSIRTYSGPRRIAAVAELAAELPATSRSERGPRLTAPDQALAGFLRKHDATRDQLVPEGDYWVLNLASPARPAVALIAEVLPNLLRRFPWPKSMRWGGGSAFTWVRPLRRILCLLDGVIVPFNLRNNDDDGHNLGSCDLTEGHRFCDSPGPFSVRSGGEWEQKLAQRQVLINAEDRRKRVMDGFRSIEREDERLAVVPDPELIDEVIGLVEWPVVLLGHIDERYMDLPDEVMQVSMRVNQRYFQLVDMDRDTAAPFFAFVANIEPRDGHAAIIAGNERVLRARFADARYFWDLDRAVTLDSRVAALGAITFHAKLGSQADRVRRITRLAVHIAPMVGADREQAARGAQLAKADLTTGMVGEFPELQGFMGRHYAIHDGEAADVANAIRDHYLPKGPDDPLPGNPIATAVALADKLDTLAGFFGIGELPTGSADPYALRRAALGVLRILWEGLLRIELRPLLNFAAAGHAAHADTDALLTFLLERLRVQLRSSGARHDVVNAVAAVDPSYDIVRLRKRGEAVGDFLATDAGANLLTAYRRAANILRIEEKKDGPFAGPPVADLLSEPAERNLHAALDDARPDTLLAAEDDTAAMATLAKLRAPVDAFFDSVKVNDADPALRGNRLRLLGALRDTMNLAADFSRIEG